jgi:nucleoside-diphosphate-sugar epimerase
VPAAAGDVTQTLADPEHARTLLDWRPRTPLDEGIAAQLAYLTRNMTVKAARP